MKLLIFIPASLLSTLILTACLGSSSSSPVTPQPPIAGDVVRYSHLGLNQVAVEHLYQSGQSVWIAGNGQLYVSHNLMARNAEEANWQIQLEGAHFTYVGGFGNDVLFALGIVENATQNTPLTELYRSRDGGDSWETVKHDFGNSVDGHDSTLQVLLPDPATGYLYATGQDLLAISYDEGDNWEILHGDTGLTARNFTLALQPRQNRLWWGGQNAIEQSSLHRFSLHNENHRSWIELFPSPSTTEDIVFDRINSDRILIATEGGIGLTENNGEGWQQVILHNDGTFHMAVVQSRNYPDAWYSARWQKGQTNQQLVFDYSKDGGHSWQQSRHNATTENYGMRHMILLNPAQDSQDVLWLGLQNGQWEGGGVMRVSVDLEEFN